MGSLEYNETSACTPTMNRSYSGSKKKASTRNDPLTPNQTSVAMLEKCPCPWWWEKMFSLTIDSILREKQAKCCEFAQVWLRTSPSWRMETLGDASKAQFGTATAQDLINRRFLLSAAHPLQDLTKDWQQRAAMETFTTTNSNSGFTSIFSGDSLNQGQSGLWRPWTGKEERKTDTHKVTLITFKRWLFFFFFLIQTCSLMDKKNLTTSPCCFQTQSSHGNLSDANYPKTPQVVHPVK